MKWAVEWPEPRLLEERLHCAARCDSDLGWSEHMGVYVDSMENDFCGKFKAWPAGCYVVAPGPQLLYAATPPKGEIFFDMEQLFGFLQGLQLPSEAA